MRFLLLFVLVILGVNTAKIFLDTDICDDMDDAVALLSILGSSRRDDLAVVSTVGFSSDRRAVAVAKLLDQSSYRSNVTVFAGSSEPMDPVVGGLFFPFVEYCDFMLKAKESEQWKFNQTNVVEGLIDQLGRQPLSSVDLLLIGPVTNYGRVFAKRPDLLDRVRSVSIQGGYPTANATMCGRQLPLWLGQYNLDADVPATMAIFRALANLKLRIPVVRLVGAQVTTRTFFTDIQYQVINSVQSPALRTLSDGLFFFHTEYLNFRCHDEPSVPYVFLHDPLTASTVLTDQLADFLTLTPTIFTFGVDNDGTFRSWPVGNSNSLGLAGFAAKNGFAAENVTFSVLWSTDVNVEKAKSFILKMLAPS